MTKEYEWKQPNGDIWLVETTNDSIIVRNKENFELISEKKNISAFTIKVLEDNFFATVATETSNIIDHEDDWIKMRYV